MYMYRKVSEYLKKWKDSKYRKPLMIQGARQVGKTYAILEFGHTYYDNVAYFNFQTSETIAATFDENISPSYLLPSYPISVVRPLPEAIHSSSLMRSSFVSEQLLL